MTCEIKYDRPFDNIAPYLDSNNRFARPLYRDAIKTGSDDFTAFFIVEFNGDKDKNLRGFFTYAPHEPRNFKNPFPKKRPFIGLVHNFSTSYEEDFAVIVHELRHAWQYRTLPPSILLPQSVSDYVLLQRAIEADARAIDIAHFIDRYADKLENDKGAHKRMREDISFKNVYSHILPSSHENISVIIKDKAKLKSYMRAAFNRAMVDQQLHTYDDTLAERIEDILKTNGLNRVFNRFSTLVSRKPDFKTDAPSAEYAQRLAVALGQMPDPADGNYLTEGAGVDLADPMFRRVGHPRLLGVMQSVAPRRS